MLNRCLLHSFVRLLVHLPLIHTVTKALDVIVWAKTTHRHSHVLSPVDLEVAECWQKANRHQLQLTHVSQENASSVFGLSCPVNQTAIVIVNQQLKGV